MLCLQYYHREGRGSLITDSERVPPKIRYVSKIGDDYFEKTLAPSMFIFIHSFASQNDRADQSRTPTKKIDTNGPCVCLGWL